jgi:hypothetical protein
VTSLAGMVEVLFSPSSSRTITPCSVVTVNTTAASSGRVLIDFYWPLFLYLMKMLRIRLMDFR